MRVLLLVIILGVALAQTDYSGTYSSNYCGDGSGSCAASFYVCHDPSTGLLQGVYSRVGYMRGFVDIDGNFTGSYFEAGTAGPLISGFEAQPNTGEVSLQFSTSPGAVSAIGNSYYAGTSILHWGFAFARTSTTVNSADCWSAPLDSGMRSSDRLLSLLFDWLMIVKLQGMQQ